MKRELIIIKTILKRIYVINHYLPILKKYEVPDF